MNLYWLSAVFMMATYRSSAEVCYEGASGNDGNDSYQHFTPLAADPSTGDDEDEGDGEGDGEGEGEEDGDTAANDPMSGFVKFAIVASVYTVTIGALFVLMGVF